MVNSLDPFYLFPSLSYFHYPHWWFYTELNLVLCCHAFIVCSSLSCFTHLPVILVICVQPFEWNVGFLLPLCSSLLAFTTLSAFIQEGLRYCAPIFSFPLSTRPMISQRLILGHHWLSLHKQVQPASGHISNTIPPKIQFFVSNLFDFTGCWRLPHTSMSIISIIYSYPCAPTDCIAFNLVWLEK